VDVGVVNQLHESDSNVIFKCYYFPEGLEHGVILLLFGGLATDETLTSFGAKFPGKNATLPPTPESNFPFEELFVCRDIFRKKESVGIQIPQGFVATFTTTHSVHVFLSFRDLTNGRV
jgi:hypothetical protein